MPTYIWTEVLTDYTHGLIVVKAKNKEEAWKLLEKEDETAYKKVAGKRIRGERTEPQKLEDNQVEVVWGGM